MKVKRLLSACAAVSMLIGTFNTIAFADGEAQNVPSATALNSVINISGKADGARGMATVMLAKKNQESLADTDIKYFGDVKLADDGEYSISFPYDSAINLSDYEVKVSDGVSVKNASIESATRKVSASFKALKKDEAMSVAGLAVSISNIYKTDLTNYKLIAAAYKGEQLENVIYEDASEGMRGGKLTITKDTTDVRCYLWDNIMPAVNEPKKTVADLKSSASSIATLINCWGDSLTYGVGGDSTTYPAVIDSLADASVTVNNYGVGGEATREIAGRMGAVPFVLSADITIPADITEVLIELNGGEILKQGGNAKYSIDGVSGTLEKTNQPTVYSFTRDAAGDAKQVAKGTQVLPVGVNLNGVNIIWTGANDRVNLKNDFDGTKNYIFDIHEKMINKVKDAGGKYIIVGITAGDENADYTAVIKEFEEYQAAKYGDNFLNLRSLLTDEKTYAKYNVTLSEDDKAMMASGRVPSAILADDKLHFNATGYQIIGKIIYNKLMSLGLTM